MKRRLLNFLTGLSLVLWAGVCGLWARSYFRSDWVCYAHVTHQTAFIREDDLTLFSGEGNAWAAFTRMEEFPPGVAVGVSGWIYEADEPDDAAERVSHPVWGFGYEAIRTPLAGTTPPSYRQWGVAFPLWLAALAFAALPAIRLLRRIRRRRSARVGLCRRCGYDLRATPGRCPECGTAVFVSPTA